MPVIAHNQDRNLWVHFCVPWRAATTPGEPSDSPSPSKLQRDVGYGGLGPRSQPAVRVSNYEQTARALRD